MSDRDMRELLEAIIDDIDSGLVTVRRAGRLGRLVGTGLVAATIGLAGGCNQTAVGTETDGAPTSDAAPISDAGAHEDVWVDSGPLDTYGYITDDAVVDEDANVDAVIDAEIFYPPYAAPPVYDFIPA